MNQEVAWYSLIATFTSTVSHVIMICIFNLWLDMGYQGVILATGLMFFVRFAVNFGLVELRNDVRKYEDVYLFSMETFSNIKPFVKKCLASMALGIWGLWTFDILTLMATYMVTAETGAQTIMRSISLLTYMIPAGFMTGARIVIGKSVGEERVNLAMQYYRVA